RRAAASGGGGNAKRAGGGWLARLGPRIAPPPVALVAYPVGGRRRLNGGGKSAESWLKAPSWPTNAASADASGDILGPRGAVNARILLVEDDLLFSESLAFILRQEGYAVEVAPSGGEGLQQAARDEPDVVLLDVALPDLSGVEVCRRLR